jgi:hypothetical protein
VDTQVIKSGSNYVEIINSELQCVSGVQITGAGTVSIVGNKCWAVAISNASANVLIKDCFQVITPSVTAGTLQIDGSAIFAASPSSNAVTSSASSFITLANSFVLNSAGTNVERVSLSGFYSILNLVYDKPNSTLIATSGTGGNLNAIDYFSVVNADTVAGTSGLTLSTVGSNGSITLDPNGTGNVVMTFANGGNLTNDRNYVAGAIRNATTAAAGDMWSFTNGSGTGYRGLSVDNSAGTTKAPGTVLRGFTGGAVAANGTTPTLIFERARGTSASPTAVQSADFLGRIVATGANGAGTFLGDTVAASPATLQFDAAENFVSNTNVGTTMVLRLMPTGKTLASVATPTVVFTTNPQSTTWASDAFTWTNGNTIAVPNTTTKMTLDSSGNLSNTGTLTTTGNISTTAGSISATGVFDNISVLSANADLLNTNTNAGSSVNIKTTYWTSSAKTTRTVPQANYALGNFRFESYSDTAGTYVLANSVQSAATENFTSTANGTKVIFTANKIGKAWNDTSFNNVVLSTSPDATTFSSDTFTFQDSASPTPANYATFNSTKAQFTKPVQFPSDTVANWNAVTGAVGMQVCVSNSSTSPTQTEDGMMAYWGTTATAGWKYIHDNRAI